MMWDGEKSGEGEGDIKGKIMAQQVWEPEKKYSVKRGVLSV